MHCFDCDRQGLILVFVVDHYFIRGQNSSDDAVRLGICAGNSDLHVCPVLQDCGRNLESAFVGSLICEYHHGARNLGRRALPFVWCHGCGRRDGIFHSAWAGRCGRRGSNGRTEMRWQPRERRGDRLRNTTLATLVEQSRRRVGPKSQDLSNVWLLPKLAFASSTYFLF